MPNYTFQRPDGELLTKRLSFTDYDAIIAGDKQMVDAEGNELILVFNPGEVGFVLKDGESGGWAGRAIKENKYRAQRSKVMAKREKDHVFKNRLVPNYEGQEGNTWAEVQSHAKAEKGELAASTYDSLVTKEKAGATT